jgi:gas vesicle protein
MNVIGRTLKFTIGLALGAGIGAVAATFLSPQSGKVSVDEIKSRLDAAKQAGQDAQHKREKELQTYWEQEVNVTYKDDKKEAKKDEKKDEKKDNK